jgi:nitroreductase
MDKPASADPSISPLLTQRWSPRAFARRPIAAADLDALLEAFRWAPSAGNLQPWRVVVGERRAGPDGALVSEGTHALLVEGLTEGNRRWASEAPVLMVTLGRRVRDGGKENTWAAHDVGLATAMLLVEATARGLRAHVMAGVERETLRASLRVPPELEVLTAIAVGHDAAPEDLAALPEDLQAKEQAPRTRLSRGEFVHSGPLPDDAR